MQELTVAERARLGDCRALAEYAERFTAAELRRLLFARWLVQAGRLNEGTQ